MNELSRSGVGISGKSFDRFVEHQDSSTLNKVQQQYWATKQAVFRKLGKKEDEHIVASDFELDNKLELFCAIQDSSNLLQKIVEQYQDKIIALSHEENVLGRYLKENGKTDKTRAGKMMHAAGKTMSYASQQRLAVRVPLVRLHQEVETFRLRAIADTLITVNQMETSRNDYRGALLWMKDISQELDPDTYKQLEKFRKVQTHVRKTKSNFEKLKVDCLQKVDLLAASRCNMFSHALATYHNTLLQFWEKSSRTMTAIAESFKGYQHYEFNMLKELTEVGKKLAQETSSSGMKPFLNEDGEIDKDRLIYFEEYHDEEASSKPDKNSNASSAENIVGNTNGVLSEYQTTAKHNSDASLDHVQNNSTGDVPLLDLTSDSVPTKPNEVIGTLKKPVSKISLDLLTSNPDVDDSEKDDFTLLSEILNAQPNAAAIESFDQEWDNVFNRHRHPMATSKELDEMDKASSFQEFLPSQLLDLKIASLNIQQNLTVSGSNGGSSLVPSGSPVKKPPQKSGSNHPSKTGMTSQSKKTTTKDMSAWFSLFADLDPLANPDALGKRTGDQVDDDRNC